MEKKKIISLLTNGVNATACVEKFASYIIKLTENPKNTWLKSYTEEMIANLYKRVLEDGLVFDGQHISLQPNGISYDYVAYKNKMILAYPESLIDVQLVYKEDKFNVAKESGGVIYSHEIGQPFNRTDDDVIGGYCVIKNKRGETLTMLSKEDIAKHRKLSKMNSIWNDWFVEMALKTVIKKACKNHCSDVFERIEENDNENYDLDNPLGLEIELKQKIEDCKTVDEVHNLYRAEKDNVKDTAAFNQYLAKRKKEIKDANTSNAPKVA